MDENKKNPEIESGNDWLDEILKSPRSADKGLDTGAETMGLPSMADMELEKIIQETMADDWTSADDEILLPEIEETLHGDDFKDTFGTGEMLDPAYYTDNGELPPETEEPEEDLPDEEDPEDPDYVPRKVRPKRKNTYGLFGLPHLASTVIWALVCIAVGISLGRLAWVCASEILAFGRPDQTVSITIVEGDNIDTVTEKLYDAGLIRYPSLFKFYAGISKAEKKISAGTFDLNTAYDYHALVGGMTANSTYRQSVKIVVPEGYTCAQIFSLLEKQGVCTVAELEEFCANGEIRERWFLEGVTRGTKYCLEGYLSPDTYQFYIDDTPSRVIGKFLDAFGAKMEAMAVDPRVQLDALNDRIVAMYKANGYTQAYGEERKLTFHQLVTLASMIEKESANAVESYTVAAVIYNRLTLPREFPKLQIDATLVYALGGKTDNLAENKFFDSPYNTYLYEGLPPGAICNPGAYSFYAAFDPDEESYFYYALDPETNAHKFFKTYREHLEFLESLTKSEEG